MNRRTESDKIIIDHIEHCNSLNQDPVGSSIIASMCQTVIKEDHILDYILDTREDFDLSIDNDCNILEESEAA